MAEGRKDRGLYDGRNVSGARMWLEVGAIEDSMVEAMYKEQGCGLSFLPPATPLLLIHCVRHTVLSCSYLQPHPGSLYIASTILSSVAPTSSPIVTPDTLRPSYSPLSFLPPATPLLLIHCVHIASIIQSSVFPTSSHTLAPYTLRPPYSPLSLLPPNTSRRLIHCVQHAVLGGRKDRRLYDGRNVYAMYKEQGCGWR